MTPPITGLGLLVQDVSVGAADCPRVGLLILCLDMRSRFAQYERSRLPLQRKALSLRSTLPIHSTLFLCGGKPGDCCRSMVLGSTGSGRLSGCCGVGGDHCEDKFRDCASVTKRKAAALRREQQRTGGGSSTLPPLTPDEGRVLAILGPEVLDGVPGGIDVCGMHTSQTLTPYPFPLEPSTSGPLQSDPQGPSTSGTATTSTVRSLTPPQGPSILGTPQHGHPAEGILPPRIPSVWELLYLSCCLSTAALTYLKSEGQKISILRGIRQELAALREQNEQHHEETMAYRTEKLAIQQASRPSVNVSSPLPSSESQFGNRLNKYIRHYEGLSYDTDSLHSKHQRAKRALSHEDKYVHLDFHAHGRGSQVSHGERERVKAVNVRTTVLWCSRSLLKQDAGGQETRQFSSVSPVNIVWLPALRIPLSFQVDEEEALPTEPASWINQEDDSLPLSPDGKGASREQSERLGFGWKVMNWALRAGVCGFAVTQLIKSLPSVNDRIFYKVTLPACYDLLSPSTGLQTPQGCYSTASQFLHQYWTTPDKEPSPQ
ncbi:hypothetical protein NFI96_002658 [Prochilodus magdalenae]|nr:hypothetical protein NFI96_002658 [Prochilodus magdalenae]